MPLPPSRQEAETLISRFLANNLPDLYQRRQAGGQLEEVVKARAEVYEQTLDQLLNQAFDTNLAGQEKANHLENARDQAIEQALSVALEFPNDPNVRTDA